MPRIASSGCGGAIFPVGSGVPRLAGAQRERVMGRCSASLIPPSGWEAAFPTAPITQPPAGAGSIVFADVISASLFGLMCSSFPCSPPGPARARAVRPAAVLRSMHSSRSGLPIRKRLAGLPETFGPVPRSTASAASLFPPPAIGGGHVSEQPRESWFESWYAHLVGGLWGARVDSLPAPELGPASTRLRSGGLPD